MIKMNSDHASVDLHTAWEKYQDFESYSRKIDGDLILFFDEWMEKMANVQAIGCQYSDLLLGLKLMDKVNLSQDSIEDVISKLGTVSSSSGSFLSQVVTNIKLQIAIDKSFGNRGEEKAKEKNQEMSEKLENCRTCVSFPVKFMEDERPVENGDKDTILKNVKEGSRPDSGFLRCPICDKNFMLHETLQNHVKNHANPIFDLVKDSSVDQEWIDSTEIYVENQMDEYSSDDQIKKEIKIETSQESDVKNISVENIQKNQLSIYSDRTFKCRICQKEYTKFYLFKTHMETHNSTRDHTCSFCNNSYQTKQGLYDHLSRKHRKDRNSAITVQLNDLNNKSGRSNDSPFFEVKKRKDKNSMKKGIADESSQIADNDIEDAHGNEKLRDKERPNGKIVLNTHKKFHCDICGKSFIKKNSLSNHVKIHTREPHKCSMCPKEYRQLCDLKVHLETHKDTRDHVCSFCDKSYKTKYGLNEHIANKHTKKKGSAKKHVTNIREVCGDLVKSEKIPENKTPLFGLLTEYPCEICGKTFFKNNLKKHVEKHSRKTLECSICQKQCKDACRLRIHMDTHNTTKDYICSYCGKKFKSQATLNEHLNMHTKAKPLPCKFCDKIFFSYGLRRFHIRAHHTGEKPYKCDFCEKRFYISTRKVQHMRCHTGEKPYPCSLCGRYFREGGTLKRHIRNVHKEVKPGDI